jgi:hypothetical protein
MVDFPYPSYHIARLPKDHRGFPVPWFVQWFKDGKPSSPGVGEPDFRIVDVAKFTKALKQPICWICGGMMGRNRVFMMGPMSCINNTTGEPPSHRTCAIFAAQTCPFLCWPRRGRNTEGLPETKPMAGYHSDNNPGVVCLWTSLTTGYYPFLAGVGNEGYLIKLRVPKRVEWYAEGKPAGRLVVAVALLNARDRLNKLADTADDLVRIEQLYQRALMFLPLGGDDESDANHLSGLPDRSGEDVVTGCPRKAVEHQS